MAERKDQTTALGTGLGQYDGFCRYSFVMAGESAAREFWSADVGYYMDSGQKGGELDGLADFNGDWGTRRYANNAAFSARLLWKVTNDPEARKQLRDFVHSQVQWARGDNHFGHSFIVGVAGTQGDAGGAPRYPHHENAYGRDLDGFAQGGETPLISLTSAMVGASTRDGWNDDLTDYETNEVSIDDNSAIVGARAARAYIALVESIQVSE